MRWADRVGWRSSGACVGAHGLPADPSRASDPDPPSPMRTALPVQLSMDPR